MKRKKQFTISRTNEQISNLLSFNLVMLFMLMEQQALNNIRSSQLAAQKEHTKLRVFNDPWLEELLGSNSDEQVSMSQEPKQLQSPDTSEPHIDNTP